MAKNNGAALIFLSLSLLSVRRTNLILTTPAIPAQKHPFSI
jgi:hypothetical protein